MRHGIAEDWADGGDAERALTSEGRARIGRMSAALTAMGVTPQVAVASPLRRAQETATILLENCVPGLELVTEPVLVPSASPERTIARLVDHAPGDGGVLLAVGHNPSVTAILGQLVCGDPGIHFAVSPGDLAHIAVESTGRGTRGVLRAYLPSTAVEQFARGGAFLADARGFPRRAE